MKHIIDLFSRLLDELLGPPTSDVIEPAKRVEPDPAAAAALERRLAELDYEPTVSFYKDQVQQRCPQ